MFVWNRVFSFTSFVLIFLLVCSNVFSNNLTITNVQLGSRDPNAKTVKVLFDVAWENSWRNKINHDAAWVTVRLSDGVNGGVKSLCTLNSSGSNPDSTSSGSNLNAEVFVPNDKIGALIRPRSHQSIASFISKKVMLTVNYGDLGLSDNSNIVANVMGLEMIFVPEGSFYAGDFGFSNASLKQGSNDNEPWVISSNAPVSVENITSNGYYYVSAGNSDELASGSNFVIPQEFPKGYGSFYAMKYEITEGQWVDFVNSLPVLSRPAHDLTDSLHKNSDSIVFRNTLQCSGSPLTCSTQRPARAVGYLSWKDFSAYLDWAGLRPMTELEYEKGARGPYMPVAGEFSWGNTIINPVNQLSGTVEDGNEFALTPEANAHCADQILTGGDSTSGPDSQEGPIRSGLFSTATSSRVSSGAGNYGMMELSGNLKEWVVTIGNLKGLIFTGKNGDGGLSLVSGFEGNANTEGWPGLDVTAANGITSASGAGLRGGSWSDSTDRLHVSDRSEASTGPNDAKPEFGGRGVRSYDAQ